MTILVNDFSSKITSSVATTATSLVLASIPTGVVPTAANPLALTLFSKTDAEIVKVVAIDVATKTLTVVRAQEGLSAIAWPVDTPIAAFLTAATVINSLTETGGILEKIIGSGVLDGNTLALAKVGIMCVVGDTITFPDATTRIIQVVDSDDLVTFSAPVTASTLDGDWVLTVPNGRVVKRKGNYRVWRA